MGKVANINDIVQFHRKKKPANRALKSTAEEPDEDILAELSIDSVKVDKLVKEFLTAQTLTILPQNSFGDAVSQFVDKDDKHAMETFVGDSLKNQLKHLMAANEIEEEEITKEMAEYREQLEDLFASGQLKKTRRSKVKPKPAGWDSDFDGSWADQPAALVRSDNEGEKDDDESLASITTKKAAPRGRGKAAGTSRATAAAAKKAAPKKAAPVARATGGRGKKKAVVEEEESDNDEDVIMIDDDDDEEVPEEDDEDSAEDLFVASQKKPPARKAAARTTTKPLAKSKSPAKKTTTTRAKAGPAATQTKLNFSQTLTQRSQPTRAAPSRGKKAVQEPVSNDNGIYKGWANMGIE